MRRKLLIGASLLAACAFAGGAYAAASSDTNPKQAFLNDVAKRLHVTPQQLRSAFEGATEDRLNAAVKAGRLTQAQANAIEKRMREGGVPLLPFFGPGLMHRGLHLGGGAFFGGPLGSAAKYIGISPGKLFDQLGAGKSLAQIAKAHGKSVAGLERAMVAAERLRLDRARENGLITNAQEQRLLGRLQQRISALVNRAAIAPRFRPLPGPRPFFGPRIVPPGYPAPVGPPPLS